MIYKVYCLGKCGTLLAYGDIDLRYKSVRKQEGYCDNCKPKPAFLTNPVPSKTVPFGNLGFPSKI